MSDHSQSTPSLLWAGLRRAPLAAALLLSLGAVHFAVPQTDVVRVVGVETKRVDVAGEPGTGNGASTRDVYFIQTESLEGAKPRVYRNEDNWMLFKFDSADVQAQAASLAAGKTTVAVRHYGWRIRLFSVFPNALDVRETDRIDGPVPIAFLSMLALVWGGIFWLRSAIKGRLRRTFGRAEAGGAS